MEIDMTVKKEFDVRYLRIDAHVRYWEDTDVNGVPDTDIEESDNELAMPFSDRETSMWHPTVDVEDGRIINWPKGTTASVHYKVCDEGTYTLLDQDMAKIVEIESYVPNCIGEYGDYIVMEIDEDGYIEGFSFGQDDADEMIENQF